MFIQYSHQLVFLVFIPYYRQFVFLEFIMYFYQLLFLVFILYSRQLEHISNLKFKYEKSTTYSLSYIRQSMFSPSILTCHNCVLFLLSAKTKTYSSFYIPWSTFSPLISTSHDYVFVWVLTLSCTQFFILSAYFITLSMLAYLVLKASKPRAHSMLGQLNLTCSSPRFRYLHFIAF